MRSSASPANCPAKACGARRANVLSILAMLIATVVATPMHAQLSAACQSLNAVWSGGVTAHPGDAGFYQPYFGFGPNEEIYYTVTTSGTAPFELNAAPPGDANSAVFGIEADLTTTIVPETRPNGGAEVNTSGVIPVNPSLTYYPYTIGSSNPGATGDLIATVGCRSSLPPAPTVTGLSPTSGSTAGGESITITGTNLTGASAVTFGGTAASSVVVNSATSITVVAPAHAAGTVDVTVTTTGGTSATSAADFYTFITPFVFSPASGALSNGTVGTAYHLSLATSGGTAPYTYAVSSGSIPAGLTLSSAGVFSGVPTTAGNATFSVRATDAVSNTGTVNYTLTINPIPAPVANAVSATVAANSSANPIPLSISGGAASSVAVASGSTHGTATASGTSISYTPTAGYSGNDSFTYTATNASGTSAPATVTVTVSAPTLVLAPPSGALSDGTVGVAYTQTVSASAGTAPYTYLITSGSIPLGLTINPSTGVLAGVPVTVESRTFTVTATDAHGATGTATYTFAIVAPPIVPPVAGNVTATVAANSATNPITLSLSGGTATSVAIASAAAHGTATASGTSITYTPVAGYSGSDSFTYTATNVSGTSAPATVTVTVSAPTLIVTPSSGTLVAGTVGVAYTQSVTVTGGTAPYSYLVTTGHAPAGLTLNPSSGVLAGTPTTAGSQTFTVRATDTYGATGIATYTIAIAAAPIALPIAGNVTATVAANSSANSVTLALSGGAATSVAIASAAAHGTATVSGTSITYTPTASYSGSDSFTYTATNASGTSAPATVTVNVSAPTLVVTPTAGALPNGTAGVAYAQTVSVAGGLAPYHYAATGLPAGLAINASTGAITGTPTTAGNQTVTVTVHDAGIATATVTYTLAIGAPNPTAAPLTATTTGGKLASLNLTTGATGGPFTSATIVSMTPVGAATATILTIDSTNGRTFQLNVTPKRGFGGTIVITYQLVNAANVSASATATIIVETRPDPSADPRVRALSDAQTEATRRFSHAQADNFMRRAENLHGAGCGQSQMGIVLTTSDPMRDTSSETSTKPAPFMPSALPHQPGRLATRDSAVSRSNAGSSNRCNGSSVAVWVGGVLDISTRSAGTNQSKIAAATTGLSVGVDKAIAKNVKLGMGVGVGTDGSDVADGDAHSAVDAHNIAIYGSATPIKGVFVDGMVSQGWLQFGTSRLVSQNTTTASGAREGHFTTATLSTGADRQSGAFRWSLYGRGEYLNGTLNAYGETGADVYDLRFDARDVRSVLGIAGFKAAHREVFHFGIVDPSIRGEWQHELTDGTNQTLDYADLDGPSFYTMAAQGWSREEFTVTPSVAVTVPSGWKFNIEFGVRGADGERATTSRVQIGRVW